MTDVAKQELLAHDLLREAAPDELEFFPHYVRAATNAGNGGRLGPEFGIEEAASVGPTVVAIGMFLYPLLLSWVADVPHKVVEGYFVDRGKELLKAWLHKPEKGKAGGGLTAKAKTEILSTIARLVAKADLPPSEAERVTKLVARHLFSDEH
ncbi:hypothetical protein GFL21_28995 [Rhizobium anhuiense]|uniref:hypothetical protein n=1 Tax=Rhizobium anhuiense TaxID=1184720 RepID=UPI001441BD26|nr:hypothetical protein [Rhizobium anhuiense]NKM58485.1 hypothetical protein [Rhizobium anhuiense]